MKHTVKKIIVISLLLLAVCFLSASNAEGTDEFSQAVPFGIAHSDVGDNILVYNVPDSKLTVGSLENDTICSLLDTVSINGQTWYKIGFFDHVDFEQTGYIKGDSFNQLTVAGLINAMTDYRVVSYLQQFSGVALGNNYVNVSPGIVRSAASVETESQDNEIKYVLNTNTKKFHYPWCSSVNDIKKKHRKDFSGTRDQIPEDYKPCKKCNP